MSLELPLTYLHRPVDPATDAPWLLVLLHGVGSNEVDLFGLAPAVPRRFNVLSLRAPFRLGSDSFGWFTFVIRSDGHRQIDAEQELNSRTILTQVIPSAAEQLSIPAERIVVGGFSQGGIMSLSLLLTRPELMAAAVVMHSRLLPEVEPLMAPAEALQGRRLWVSHGTKDSVMPLAEAHNLRDRVRQLPIELSYQEFPGGHEIRTAELSAVTTWLNGLVAGR